MSTTSSTDEPRDATAREIRALGHPLRWRILRLTLDEPLTNKQLAERLGRDPGTVLHHVRVLVQSGFLAAADVRAGKRGALERPYRATGKSWQIRVGHHPDAAGAILDAARDELAEAGPSALVTTLRLGTRLSPADIDLLKRRIGDLGVDFAARDDPAGEPVSIVAVVHRRR